MKRIELTGPSGVGKTTLFLQISKLPETERSFLTVREAYAKAASKKKISVSKPKAFLFQKALKTGLFRSKEYGLSKRIMQELYSDNGNHDLYDSHKKFYASFNILYQQYRKEMDPNHVLKRLTTFLDKVEELEILERNLPNGEMVLFDEGVLHHHFGVTPSGLEAFSDDELNSDKALNPNGVISCELSEDEIYQRAMKRKREGIKTYSQGDLEGDQLRKRIRITIGSNKQKIESFRKRNIPVLHINTGDEPAKNIEQIIQFISNLN